MNCGHRIPPRGAPRAFLGDKDIGLTSCDLQKRSLGGIQNVLCSQRSAQRKKAMGAVDPRPVHWGGGGGGVSRLPMRRQKKAAKAMTATMIKTPATIRTVF